MGKLSTLGGGSPETTFGLSDFLVKIKAGGAGDVRVGLADFLNAIGGSTFCPYKFSVGNSGSPQVIGTGATKIHLNTVAFDTHGDFDATTNYRFTTPVNGFYQFNVKAEVQADTQGVVCLFKNGSEVARGSTSNSSAGTAHGSSCSRLLQLTAGDYIELWWNYDTVGSNTVTNDVHVTYLDGYFVSAT